MKTIRKEVFETNSSSTHSLNIRKIPTEKSVKLIENNILYADMLSNLSTNIEDGSIIQCKTQIEKAAMVVQWITTLYHDKNISELQYNNAINAIKEVLNINEIKCNTPVYYHYCERSDVYIHEDSFDEDFKILIEIIEDSSIMIEDSYLPY